MHLCSMAHLLLYDAPLFYDALVLYDAPLLYDALVIYDAQVYKMLYAP